MNRTLTLTTGSRLHFGLYAFGPEVHRQFGGVGAMVEVPLRLEAELSEDGDVGGDGEGVEVIGPHARRVSEFVKTWKAFAGSLGRSAESDGWRLRRVRVASAPSEHVGLGLGTQLGLATAALLNRVTFGESLSLRETAESVGRGLRSAVGSYGFFYGGMIVDQGKRAEEGLSPLQSRWMIPADWRWVLVEPPLDAGLHGAEERRAFAQLPSMSVERVAVLRDQIDTRLVPALASGDYSDFGESLFQYGRSAGECFSSVQGGPYRTTEIEDLVYRIRDMGYPGVGQSSWGPTVFALTPGQREAEGLVVNLHDWLESSYGDASAMKVRTVAPRNVSYQLTDEIHLAEEVKQPCPNSASISTT